MNRTYEDMSKKELVTLVKRMTKQHDEWSDKAERLRRVLELIGENMAYHSWMHTLIKEAVGYEKVIE